jgi:hypothetical protein
VLQPRTIRTFATNQNFALLKEYTMPKDFSARSVKLRRIQSGLKENYRIDLPPLPPDRAATPVDGEKSHRDVNGLLAAADKLLKDFESETPRNEIEVTKAKDFRKEVFAMREHIVRLRYPAKKSA